MAAAGLYAKLTRASPGDEHLQSNEGHNGRNARRPRPSRPEVETGDRTQNCVGGFASTSGNLTGFRTLNKLT